MTLAPRGASAASDLTRHRGSPRRRRKGPKPSATDSSLSFGDFGVKGLGGAPGSNDGLDGLHGELLEVP